MNGDPSRHFQSFILELAAIVFLLITAPFWLPLVGVLLVGGLYIAIAGAIILFLISMCSQSRAEPYLLTNVELQQITEIRFNMDLLVF